MNIFVLVCHDEVCVWGGGGVRVRECMCAFASKCMSVYLYIFCLMGISVYECVYVRNVETVAIVFVDILLVLFFFIFVFVFCVFLFF